MNPYSGNLIVELTRLVDDILRRKGVIGYGE
jgi:hypothetical protein